MIIAYEPYLSLSENFRLFEFTRSRVARRRGIENRQLEEHILANLRHLCRTTLEPIRALAGRPVKITSGYRSPVLNRAVGGAAESQHLTGQAADFVIPGLDICDIALRLQAESGLIYDQLILEERARSEGHPLGPYARWIHISCVAQRPNRQEVLTISKNLSGVRTERGIHPTSVD